MIAVQVLLSPVARATECGGPPGAPATPQIYFTDTGAQGRILRTHLDGSQPVEVVTGLVNPFGVAIDGVSGKLYFTDPGTMTIARANLDGSANETLFAYPLLEPNAPVGIALDLAGARMYWVAFAFPVIQRAALDGSDAEVLVSDPGLIEMNQPLPLALDLTGGKMYWADGGFHWIRRANLDGSNVETVIIGQITGDGLALDVDAGKMYWADGPLGRIRRANLDGSDIEPLITDGGGPNGIALDLAAGKIYWADYYSHKVRRANLDGSSPEDLVTTGLEGPVGIALWLPPPPVCGNGCVETIPSMQARSPRRWRTCAIPRMAIPAWRRPWPPVRPISAAPRSPCVFRCAWDRGRARASSRSGSMRTRSPAARQESSTETA